MIKKSIPWKYVIEKLNGEEIVRIFYEKDLQKTNKTKTVFRVEKVMKFYINPLLPNVPF